MKRLRSWLLLGPSLALLGGCNEVKRFLEMESRPAEVEIESPVSDAPDEPDGADGADEGDPDAPHEDAIEDIPDTPLEKAKRKLPFVAKGGTNMGFNVDALSELYALHGEVAVPSWSAPGKGQPSATRDDDLDSTWTCTATEHQRCALGIRFPRPSKVEIVRFFVAAGPDREAFESHPRPRVVRIHTDEGYADANLLDSREFHYAILGRPIETRTLSVEVLDVFGPPARALHVAELEVYGRRGVARAALGVDPSAAYVAFERSPWARKGDDYLVRDAMIRVLGEDDATRTLMPGSALLGAPGDRFLLVERLESTTCKKARGTYYLLDRQTRVVAPLGELGGPGGQLFRRTDGLGLALGYTDEFTTQLNGVTLEDGAYLRRRTPIREDKRPEDTFAEWKMERAPLPRGGQSLIHAPDGCVAASDDRLVKLARMRGDSKADERRPGEWRICTVGTSRIFITDRGPCGRRWEMYLVNADDELIAKKQSKRDQADVRLTRLSPERLLVETTTEEDLWEVFVVEEKAIESLGEHTVLAARPPSGCRPECEPNFPNPNAPRWK